MDVASTFGSTDPSGRLPPSGRTEVHPALHPQVRSGPALASQRTNEPAGPQGMPPAAQQVPPPHHDAPGGAGPAARLLQELAVAPVSAPAYPQEGRHRYCGGEPEAPPTVGELVDEAARVVDPGLSAHRYITRRTRDLCPDDQAVARSAMKEALAQANTLRKDAFMGAWRAGRVGPLARLAGSGSDDDAFLIRTMLLPLRARWIAEKGLTAVSDLLLLDLALARLLRALRAQELEADLLAMITDGDGLGEPNLLLLERVERYVSRSLRTFERMLVLLDGRRPLEVKVRADCVNMANQQVVAAGR